jgi:hypothetical protein
MKTYHVLSFSISVLALGTMLGCKTALPSRDSAKIGFPTTYNRVAQEEYSSHLTREAVISSPVWHPRRNNPPLSPRAAGNRSQVTNL